MAYSIPSSDKTKKYRVIEHDDGRWTCSCPHWVHRLRKFGTACKHITWAKQLKPLIEDPKNWECDWSEDYTKYNY